MIFLNARFLTQPVSGVQRYARELVGALDDALATGCPGFGPVVALHPKGEIEDPGWQAIELRAASGGQGHFWEQGALARAAWSGVLLSLGNSGPLLHPRQVICFHDANIWALPEAFSPRYRVLHRALRPPLARRAKGLMTVSRFSAMDLAPRLGVDARRFEIVPNSAAHILNIAPDARVLQRFGLTSGAYLLSVGNQSPNKNLRRLVIAHGQCGPDVPKLVVAGGRVPGLAAGQGTGLATVASRVITTGRVSDAELRALYDGAKGFVFPSLYEGFGIPPLEAMQLGVPVLASRRTALPEVLGDAPIWFDPMEISDIARSLQAFARLDKCARARMAAAGRGVASRFTWANSAGRLIELLRRVQQPDGKRTVSAVRPISPRSVARLTWRK
ncbi:glycosyltransferase family 4 protein [Primorskyibacter sp. S87]|uniref:glycosyltransferase family 4 protein n=1 Tax=Primorskyibacter sp. S87 TaxID=3415126 RepID=UPI003C7986E4